MDVKPKQTWSEEETRCFLTLWASSEVQDQLDGASRTKPVFEKIQSGMAVAGYERSLEQLINKLKKLKRDYRNQKRLFGSSGRPHGPSYFDLMDSVLGDRPANQTTEPDQTTGLNLATATTDLRLLIVDDFVVRSNGSGTELAPLEKEPDSELLKPQLQPQPLTCSSPTPSCSTSSTSSSFPETKPGKRKRDSTAELIEYLERSEERFLEQTRRDQDITIALLQNVQRMDETTKRLVGLMERMVSVMESSSRK
ncbi:uncharacterized protein LOC115415717 isoform X1 [Sphaeramia orbicularis]|uniref:uncharacterized protein LOC115415717 isoform X1 n=1 Tax=Sphaeramia orbicularis TaxID=375764 RepID=UPI00117BFC9F|nr:uncharacterized protein LOC115415717 isoform X1 [Sphaeramia orbicularis]